MTRPRATPSFTLGYRLWAAGTIAIGAVAARWIDHPIAWAWLAATIVFLAALDRAMGLGR